MLDLACRAAVDECSAGYVRQPDGGGFTEITVDGDVDFERMMSVGIAAFIGAVTPDALNRAGVPWTLEVAQALAALKAMAQGVPDER
jgi:hypothetical protein